MSLPKPSPDVLKTFGTFQTLKQMVDDLQTASDVTPVRIKVTRKGTEAGKLRLYRDVDNHHEVRMHPDDWALLVKGVFAEAGSVVYQVWGIPVYIDTLVVEEP